MFYPEGTRMTEKKLLAAQDFARKRGYPVLKHMFCILSSSMIIADDGHKSVQHLFLFPLCSDCNLESRDSAI